MPWVAEETFNDLTVGGIHGQGGGSGWSANWVVNDTGNPANDYRIVDSPVWSGSNRSFRTKNDGGGTGQARRVASGATAQGTVYFLVRVNSINAGHGVRFGVRPQNSSNEYNIDFIGGALILKSSGGDQTIASGLSANTWYEIELVFDASVPNNKARYRVEGGEWSAYTSTVSPHGGSGTANVDQCNIGHLGAATSPVTSNIGYISPTEGGPSSAVNALAEPDRAAVGVAVRAPGVATQRSPIVEVARAIIAAAARAPDIVTQRQPVIRPPRVSVLTQVRNPLVIRGLLVIVNGQDVTHSCVGDSLVVAQNLTNEVDTAQFAVRKYGSVGFQPKYDDNVQIYDGGKKIFAGKILIAEKEIEGGGSVIFRARCVDHTYEADRRLVAKTYHNQSISSIIQDLFNVFAVGFDTSLVTSDFVIQKIVFNQVPISQCLKRLADIVRYDWYIDPDKRVHFFPKFTESSPFEVVPGNYVFGSFSADFDGSQLVNRVKVRGGEYDGAEYTDIITVVGNDTKSFKLPYRFSNLQVELDTGEGFEAQDVGVDFIDSFDAKDVLYNYHDQSIHFEEPLEDGDQIKFTGNPKTPVLAIAEDAESVAKFGPIEKLIRDDAITSNEIARKRAAAELLAFADEVIDARFETDRPGLRAGQTVHVNTEGIDAGLLIKQIVFTLRDPNTFSYRVSCISTQRYTLLDLLRKIIEPRSRVDDEKEVSEEIFAVNEQMRSQDEWDFVAPFAAEEEVAAADNWEKDPVHPDDLRWVYGYFAPDDQDDPRRMGRYGRGAWYM